MNALLALSALALVAGVPLIFPGEGPAAATLFVALALAGALVVSRHESESRFLVRVFIAAALVRAAVGSLIFYFQLQDFFGGDAYTYDFFGTALTQFWKGNVSYAYYEETLGFYVHRNWGMPYTVGAIYMVVGRNMLAVQMFNAVVGAATAPLIFLSARHIFQNMRVAKVATLFVAFFPSLVLWSSQGLKDGPIVFLLALDDARDAQGRGEGEREVRRGAHLRALRAALLPLLHLLHGRGRGGRRVPDRHAQADDAQRASAVRR